MANSETKIPIPARLENVAVGGHVTGADMIIDDARGKTQDTINSEVSTSLTTLGSDKANKSEMSVTPGTGTDADKTTIQLKTNTSATVLVSHQDISGKADKSATVSNVSFDATSGKLQETINGTTTDVIGSASDSADGFMTSTDKAKLNGIAAGAEVNVNADWEASSGDAEILNKPTLGTAAAKDYVTTLDASANLITSGAVKTYADTKHGEITDLIPTAATSSNQLADKAFVNSSIQTATAVYKGSENLVSDLELTTEATHAQVAAALATAVSGADNNDYCFVQVPTSDSTPTEIAQIDRYKYDGTDWNYEYTLNNSGYTAEQWAAINSGITTGLVTKLSDLPTNSELNTSLGTKADKSELTITSGTGTATIQLKSGTSSTVLTAHQDISGKADKSATVSTVTYDTANKKLTKTINGTTTDVVTAAKIVEDGGGVQLNLLNLEDLAHDYSFKVNDALCIDGVIYKCTAATTKPPFNFVFDENNSIVYETLSGQSAFVVDSNTLNANWAVVFDVNDRYYVAKTQKELQDNINATKQDRLVFDDIPIANSYGHMVDSGGMYKAMVTIPWRVAHGENIQGAEIQMGVLAIIENPEVASIFTFHAQVGIESRSATIISSDDVRNVTIKFDSTHPGISGGTSGSVCSIPISAGTTVYVDAICDGTNIYVICNNQMYKKSILA